MKIEPKFIKDSFFFLIVIIFGFLFIRVILPFFPILVIGFIIVQFYRPIYNFILKYIPNKAFVSLVCCIFVILTIFIPFVALSSSAIQEALVIKDNVQTFVSESEVFDSKDANSPISRINKILSQIGIIEEDKKGVNVYQEVNGQEQLVYRVVDEKDTTQSPTDLRGLVLSKSDQILNDAIGTIPSLAGTFVNFLFSLFLLFIVMFFLFIEYEKLPDYFSRYFPLENGIEKLFFKKFEQTTKSVIRGSFAVAFAQATVVIIPMLLFNIQAPILWWIIMFILSLVPIGSGLVWLPMGIAMIVNPAIPDWQGVFLIVYSAIAINVVDSLIRPIFTRGGTGLHPLIALLSALGGLFVFEGFLGLLYGPLVAVFYKTAMEIFEEKYAKSNEV